MKQMQRIATLIIAAGMSLASYAQSGVKYPYVQDGKIIVSRDSRGGVKPEFIGTGVKQVEDEDSSDNKVSSKFEVYATDNGTNVSWTQGLSSTCPSGWRLPNQRELLLIYVMQKQLTITVLSGSYWSNTGSIAEYRFYLNMETGEMSSVGNESTVKNARCIKDIN